MKVSDIKKEISMEDLIRKSIYNGEDVVIKPDVDEGANETTEETLDNIEETNEVSENSDEIIEESSDESQEINETKEDVEEPVEEKNEELSNNETENKSSKKRIVKWRGKETEVDEDKIDSLLSKGLEMDEYKKAHARDINMMETIRRDPVLTRAFNDIIYKRMTNPSASLEDIIRDMMPTKKETKKDTDLYDDDYNDGATFNDEVIDKLNNKITEIELSQKRMDYENTVSYIEKKLTPEEHQKFNRILEDYITNIPGLETMLSKDLTMARNLYYNIYKGHFMNNDTSEPVISPNKSSNDTSEPVRSKQNRAMSRPFTQKPSAVLSNGKANGTRNVSDVDIANMSAKEFEKFKESLPWKDVIQGKVK